MTTLVSSALLSTQSDERLVALARGGSERAFEAIVERYRRPLHRYLRRLLPAGRVEDVLQQTLLGAWRGLQDGSGVRDLRPWLYRIAHNAAVNALARTGYDYEELRDSLRGGDGPEADVERRTVMRETLTSVAGLPNRQRRALLETAVQGRPTAEVAREMGLSDGAFRQLVHRARATLRAAATAVTPMPAAAWAAGASESGDAAGGVAARVAELAAGGGAGAAVLKTGAVVVTAGAIAAGPGGLVPVGDGGRVGDHDTTARAAEPYAAGAAAPTPGSIGVVPAANHGSAHGSAARNSRTGSSRADRGGGRGSRGRGRQGGEDDKGSARSGRKGSDDARDTGEGRSGRQGSPGKGGGGNDDAADQRDDVRRADGGERSDAAGSSGAAGSLSAAGSSSGAGSSGSQPDGDLSSQDGSGSGAGSVEASGRRESGGASSGSSTSGRSGSDGG